MIHIPINVTGWVEGKDIRRCDQCGTAFHEIYGKCPKCQSPNSSLVPPFSEGKTYYEALIPVLDNAP